MGGGYKFNSDYTYAVSQKRPTFDLLYNLDVHDPITIIFGRSVIEKV